MKRFLTVLTLVLSVFFLASCQKDDSTENSQSAPTPPAAKTLALDLSNFQSTRATSDTFFNFVATSVTVNWCTIFNSIINVPVEAYRQLIISSQPVQDGDGWIWKTQYTDGLNQTYTVSLYGEEKDNIVNWEIRVSKDGTSGYQDFTWITGWSAKDGRSGQWNVKVSPTDTDVLVTMDWTADSEKLQTLKVTYKLSHLCHGILPFFNESYILYAASATDSAYDSSLTAYYNQLGLGYWTVKVEWNSSNGSGRVSSEDKFGNSAWCCWNTSKNDVN